MSTPIETMEWVVAQFSDRAKEDPEDHTAQDAKQVGELQASFNAMLDALADTETLFEEVLEDDPDAIQYEEALEKVRAAIAQAKGQS